MSVSSVFRIPPSEVSFEKNRRGQRLFLGEGASGTVYAAKYAGEDVAVKILKVGVAGLNSKEEALFWREAECQYTCRNDHIVAVLGAYVDNTFPDEPEHGVVMQRMSGNLGDLLYNSASGPPPLLRRLQLSHQVVRARSYWL
jgi:serine/threonine protein kinase